MTKKILAFINCIFLIACTSNKVSTDYLGQPELEATPVIFAEGLISQKGRFEHGISFNPTMSELLIGIINTDESGTILHSKKVGGHWSQLETFKPLENKSAFLPYFNPDGKSLLYAQSIDDPNSLYLTNIWSLDNIDGIWENPKKLNTPVNSNSREANASMTIDGTIYLSSNRNCDGIENCFTADLFYSKPVDNNYQTTTEISRLNTASDEESIFISPKEEYLLFCRYTDNETLVDLYISYSDLNNNWTVPQMLDDSINSRDWDRRPFVSSDNKYLFFTRLQIGMEGLTESDIYWVNTSKIFKPFVYNKPSDLKAQVGEPFKFQLPIDYFKDIDDLQLVITTNASDLEWLSYDSNAMTISGIPTEKGDFKVRVTAVDQFSNHKEDSIKITVE